MRSPIAGSRSRCGSRCGSRSPSRCGSRCGGVLEATNAITNTNANANTKTRPHRFTDNAEGPLYVNDKCINCAACSMFAPSVFARETTSDTHHIVSKQPASDREIEESGAALAACPVAAIRVEKQKPMPIPIPTLEETKLPLEAQPEIHPHTNFHGRLLQLPLPFPRKVSPNLPGVYFVGHHNSKSFGAAPYLLPMVSSSSAARTPTSMSTPTWILVDTPRYSEPAAKAVESVTGPNGPSYLVLTHVDDTADHNRWKDRYPSLKRVFHAGDLGVHNWIGDETLEDVEILLESRSSERRLQYFGVNGTPIDGDPGEDHADDVVLVHTPGHSPGSIAVLKLPAHASTGTGIDTAVACNATGTVTETVTETGTGTATTSTSVDPGVLFSGDTYSYTTREGGHMSGFPRFGNDPELQSKILPLLLDLDWQVLAPGHGHVRDYTVLEESTGNANARNEEMEAAIEELMRYF